MNSRSFTIIMRAVTITVRFPEIKKISHRIFSSLKVHFCKIFIK